MTNPIVTSSTWISLGQGGNQLGNSDLTATLNKVPIMGKVQEEEVFVTGQTI